MAWSLRVGSHLALSLHSSNEPGELLQLPGHDDSTKNIVIGISISIIVLFWLAWSHGSSIIAASAATANAAAIAALPASPQPASLPADRRVQFDSSLAHHCRAHMVPACSFREPSQCKQPYVWGRMQRCPQRSLKKLYRYSTSGHKLGKCSRFSKFFH